MADVNVQRHKRITQSSRLCKQDQVSMGWIQRSAGRRFGLVARDLPTTNSPRIRAIGSLGLSAVRTCQSP